MSGSQRINNHLLICVVFCLTNHLNHTFLGCIMNDIWFIIIYHHLKHPQRFTQIAGYPANHPNNWDLPAWFRRGKLLWNRLRSIVWKRWCRPLQNVGFHTSVNQGDHMSILFPTVSLPVHWLPAVTFALCRCASAGLSGPWHTTVFFYLPSPVRSK